jgi:putative membrane protein
MVSDLEKLMNKIAMKVSLPIVAAAALLFAGSGAFAQTSTTHNTGAVNSTTTTISDSQFAKQAAQSDLAEVKLGQLAEQKGTDSTVKDFGKRMVTDHSNAQDQLKTAAAKDNITLPTTLSAKDQATYDQLSKLSGTQFDKAYAQDMVKDHTMDISQFQHEANDGKDASIKSFASDTLPTLQEHLRLAKQMSQTVSASTTTTSRTKRNA